jgi:phosphonate transport system substrate-binding protein
VDSLVYDFALAREPDLSARLRVIHRSPPFGIPPVVVGPQARPQFKAEVQALLLELSDTAEGRAALTTMGVERFVLIDDARYDSVRDLLNVIGSSPP